MSDLVVKIRELAAYKFYMPGVKDSIVHLIDEDKAQEIINICMDAAIDRLKKEQVNKDSNVMMILGIGKAVKAIESLKNDSTNT